MSRNDRHVAHDGTLRKELEAGYEEMLEHRDILDARIQTQLQEMPMLKGKGFIVVAPAQPRFDGEEYEQIEDAQERASEVAYLHGSAIIYAPIGAVKPKRETLTAVPSQLLKQINVDKGLAAGAPVAVVEDAAK